MSWGVRARPATPVRPGGEVRVGYTPIEEVPLRIEIPVLMLNGRYDFFFPLDTSQEPMYRLLGTPEEHKRHVVAEGGHDVPRALLIRETLDWLDTYLGAVER